MPECRVCLGDNVRMHLISSTRYQEMYEKLSGTTLSTEDGRPDTLCYICSTQLQKFCKFFTMSLNTEKILTRRLLGFEVSQEIKDNVKLLRDLTTTSTLTMTYVDNGEDEVPEVTVTVKEEPVDYDENEDLKEEYLDSPPADEMYHNGDGAVEPASTNGPHLPTEPVPTTLPPDYTELNQNIKTEITDTAEEVKPELTESFLRNLSMAFNSLPLNQPTDFKFNAGKTENHCNYYCSICNHKTPTEQGIKRHTKVHDQSYPHACEFCSYRFISETKLAAHRNHCTVCSICGKRFSKITGLRTHVRLHTGIQPYSCDACGRRFNQKTNLQTHMRVHAREKQYPCNICSKTFPFKSFLQRHMLIHGENHLDTEGYRRIINCHKLYPRKRKDRSCMCSLCGRILQSKEGLITHMMLHTGEKPFSCEICHRVFTQKCNLFTHVERMHNRDELFTCGICHKMFPFNSEKKRHLLSHTVTISARDFEMFQQKHIYTVHRRSYSKQPTPTPYPCDMCKTRVLSY